MIQFTINKVMALFVGAILFASFGFIIDAGADYRLEHVAEYAEAPAQSIDLTTTALDNIPIIMLGLAFFGLFVWLAYKRGV